jgi:uncharacterized paraquat-inducible protein A
MLILAVKGLITLLFLCLERKSGYKYFGLKRKSNWALENWRNCVMRRFIVFCKHLGCSKKGECLMCKWEGYVYKSLVGKSCCHAFKVGT